MRFMKEQIQIIQDRSNKIQKNLRQEVESLKLEITTLTINKEENEEKLKEGTEFLGVYKKKLNELTELHQELEDKNSQLNESLIRMTQQYKDEKIRADNLHNQKGQLSSKLDQRNDEIDRKVANYE